MRPASVFDAAAVAFVTVVNPGVGGRESTEEVVVHEK
jgi:hypothetical protein